MGGDEQKTGNIFVTNSSGYFGSVCYDGFTNTFAWVVCRQLGFSGGVATKESKYGTLASDFPMHNVVCTGSEDTLEECSYSSSNDCGGGEGAGVMCFSSGEYIFIIRPNKSHNFGIVSLPPGTP